MWIKLQQSDQCDQHIYNPMDHMHLIQN